MKILKELPNYFISVCVFTILLISICKDVWEYEHYKFEWIRYILYIISVSLSYIISHKLFKINLFKL